MENSADYHLRCYTITPDFKIKEGGTGTITIVEAPAWQEARRATGRAI